MKNFVQKEVDKQLGNICDHKDENYNKISEIYFQKTQRRKIGIFWRVFTPVMASIVIIVGTVTLVNRFQSPTVHEYFSDNEVIAYTTVDELAEESKAFSLSFDSYEITDNKRVYDSVSGDTLRFNTILKKDDSQINILYITNIYYKFGFDESKFDNSKTFQGIEVKYSSEYSAYIMMVYAYLEKDGQILLIEYQERILTDTEDLFWNMLNEVVTVK